MQRKEISLCKRCLERMQKHQGQPTVLKAFFLRFKKLYLSQKIEKSSHYSDRIYSYADSSFNEEIQGLASLEIT